MIIGKFFINFFFFKIFWPFFVHFVAFSTFPPKGLGGEGRQWGGEAAGVAVTGKGGGSIPTRSALPLATSLNTT